MAVARLRAWLVLLCIALVSVHAQAETIKTQCIQANTNAQSLRRDGKLSEAREQLRFCSQSKCPGLVVADCVKRLDELENAQPTVAFDVVDTSGREVNDVAVSIDGHPLLDKLTGAAVAVDLGEHALTFTAEGRPPVQKKFVFREGEKGRHVQVTLDALLGSAPLVAASTAPAAGAPSEPNTPPAAESTSTPASESSSGSTRRTVGFVVGGVGIASLAVGGVFGVLTLQAKKQQTDNCSSASACPDHAAAATAHHNAQTYGTISTVTFIAGAAATATGLVLIFTAKPSPRNAASSSVSVFPSAGPDGAGVAMAGSF